MSRVNIEQERRKRGRFTKEFQADVVRLCQSESVGDGSRPMDLTETAVRAWVKQARLNAGKAPSGALATEERGDEQTEARAEVLPPTSLGTTSTDITGDQGTTWRGLNGAVPKVRRRTTTSTGHPDPSASSTFAREPSQYLRFQRTAVRGHIGERPVVRGEWSARRVRR